MALFIAYNHGLSSGTSITAGQAVTTTASVTLQLGIPANGYIELVEWGVSFDEDATTNTSANACLVEVAYCSGTATTMTTAHSTTTVMPYDMAAIGETEQSRLTMTTATTGYGVNTIVTGSTTLLVPDKQYIQQTSQYVKIWPEGRYPRMGATAARLVQFRVKSTATVNAVVYAVWDEHIR